MSDVRQISMFAICANCGQIRGHHRATDKACPIGTRHRTVGYTQHHESMRFAPKQQSSEVGK